MISPVASDPHSEVAASAAAAIRYGTPRPPFPWGGWWCDDLRNWSTPQRLDAGLTIILPGIEGLSHWNIGAARGLIDAGHRPAVQIVDWTTGCRPLALYHLVSHRRNREQAVALAEHVAGYTAAYPGRPVRLLGHSGGGAMCIFTAERLAESINLADIVLLNAALSPRYPLGRALRRVTGRVWNVTSRWDLFFLGVGTLALGTVDRVHTVSAGAHGFQPPTDSDSADAELYRTRLVDRPFRWSLVRDWNLGGHFGCVNRQFVARHVAPLIDDANPLTNPQPLTRASA
jgi:hypothetical protein